MLRKIKVFFTMRLFGSDTLSSMAVIYRSKGINTGWYGPSDCVWLVP